MMTAEPPFFRDSRITPMSDFMNQFGPDASRQLSADLGGLCGKKR